MNTLIVEDEDASYEVLEGIIKKYANHLNVIGRAKTVEQAIKLIEEISPELVFLDIDLPDGTGFDIIKKIKPVDFSIIFVTAYNQYSPYHPAYDLKEDPTGTGVTDLNSLITFLNGNPTKEQLESTIDVQAFLRALAVNVMIGMADDYWRGGNNFYLYKNPSNSKWSFLPYDYDRTFGINTFGPETSTSSVINWGDNSGTSCNPILVKRILAIPQYMIDYKTYLTSMVDSGYYTESYVIGRIQQMQSAISSYTCGYNISYDSYPFSQDLSSFRTYIRKRIEAVNSECR